MPQGPQPPPSAQRAQATIAAIEAACAEIIQEYRWRHVALYGTGGSDTTEAGRLPAHESRPAENQALSAAERSGSLRATFNTLDGVRKVLQSEARKLRTRPATVERPDQFPPLISPDQHRDLVDAQRRRESRGEGWGTG